MFDSHTTIDKPTLLSMPGAEMVLKGLEDRAIGDNSIESYMVKIASPILVKAGLLSKVSTSIDDEIKLYNLLITMGETNPYGKYNSLMRLLVSFERSLRTHMSEREVRI